MRVRHFNIPAVTRRHFETSVYVDGRVAAVLNDFNVVAKLGFASLLSGTLSKASFHLVVVVSRLMNAAACRKFRIYSQFMRHACAAQ